MVESLKENPENDVMCVCVCERPLQGNDKCLMLMNASPLHTEKIEK